MIKRSEHSISEWLDAASRGRIPSGTYAEVVRVNEGDVKLVRIGTGGENGDGRHTVFYAGEKPRQLVGDGHHVALSGGNLYTFFCFSRSPSIIYMPSGHYGAEQCERDDLVFVCASDKQIAAAIAEVQEQRRRGRKAAGPKR